jgi:hypothetical protein
MGSSAGKTQKERKTRKNQLNIQANTVVCTVCSLKRQLEVREGTVDSNLKNVPRSDWYGMEKIYLEREKKSL